MAFCRFEKKTTVEIASANYSNQKSDERFKSVKDVSRLDDGLELYAGDAQCVLPFSRYSLCKEI